MLRLKKKYDVGLVWKKKKNKEIILTRIAIFSTIKIILLFYKMR